MNSYSYEIYLNKRKSLKKKGNHHGVKKHRQN
jgi:hypothetical protein